MAQRSYNNLIIVARSSQFPNRLEYQPFVLVGGATATVTTTDSLDQSVVHLPIDSGLCPGSFVFPEEIVDYSHSDSSKIDRESTLRTVPHTVAISRGCIRYRDSRDRSGKCEIVDIDLPIVQVDSDLSELGESRIGISIVSARTRVIPVAVVGTSEGLGQSFPVDLSVVGGRVDIEIGSGNGLVHSSAEYMDGVAIQ